MPVLRIALAASLLGLGLAVPSHAADAPATESATDTEAQLDESLKRFGYLAGLASGCVIEGQRPELEREAVDLSAGIARLFGTDRAFLFAASFGYGTAIEVATEDCTEVVARYTERVASFRARRVSPP